MSNKNSNKEAQHTPQKKTCGIIMPIAPHPDYPADHWKDVLGILKEAIAETEFEPKLVSDDVAIGLIHDRIVTNIYNNEIIVCDVSSKNPNVMFELGLRLAFDKPTIIIKDETTGYSFDTGVIEHISYPSSLRFSQIVKFKEELIRRINATYSKSQSEPNFSPFLKSFGKTITPASFQQTEIPEGKYILNELEIIRNEMQIMRTEQRYYDEIRYRDLNQINNNLQQDLITAVLNKYRNKLSSIDIPKDDDILFVTIKNELMMHGINVSKNALKQHIIKNIENDKFSK